MKVPKQLARLLENTLRPPKVLVACQGDLRQFIVTLPLLASLKKQVPHASIYVLVRRPNESLVTLLPQLEGSIGDPGIFYKSDFAPLSHAEQQVRYEELLATIQAHNFDLAILPQHNRAVAALLRRAGIPWRAGQATLFSWRNYNLKIRLSRRYRIKPEYQQALLVLRAIGLKPSFEFPDVLLENTAKKGKNIIVLDPVKRDLSQPVWPIKNFVAYAAAQPHRKFIVIGDHRDASLLHEHFDSLKNCHIETTLNVRQLAELLAHSDFFCGNNSGALHLAALMRVPHVGFFSQSRNGSNHRWRTLPLPGAPDTQAYLLQTSYDVGCISCIGQKCQYWPCTAAIPLDFVEQARLAWQQSQEEFARRQRTILKDESKVQGQLQNKLKQVLKPSAKKKKTQKNKKKIR